MKKHPLLLYFGAVLCMSAASGMDSSLFNNFLSDTFHLTADARGQLEFPREMPGFLVVVMAGLLCSLPITQTAMVGALLLVGGWIGLAIYGKSFIPMMTMMIVASSGLHLLQPVGSTISLALSDKGKEGRRIGQVGAMETLGVVLGTGFVWLVFDKTSPQYRLGFLCAGILAALAACFYKWMHIPDLHGRRSRFLLRKKYSLYYALEFLFGARKQIFITFGPWALIKVYHLPAPSIAKLLMIGALIGILFKPAAGWAIDRFGERRVLMFDGLALIFVCLGYGYAGMILPNEAAARNLACGCLVADNLLFALGSARAIYLSRMSPSHEETNSTLSMGISINHVVSMLIPALAGAMWVHWGYERVFLAAAVLAGLNAATASLVPGKNKG